MAALLAMSGATAVSSLHRSCIENAPCAAPSPRRLPSRTILLRIAVEEKFLKNRHVRGRDLVDDDDEIGSGDLLVLPYERLPFVPTRMLSLK